jgi:succinyl-CoA synthetase beta subunit
MRLHEYEGKKLFRRYAIGTPPGATACSKEEAEEIARSIGKPVVVKAQILAGGSGKAGGILLAESPQEAGLAAGSLLGTTIKDHPVMTVLVEERLRIETEIYVGITVNGATGSPLVMICPEGGIEIEETALRFPDRLATLSLDIFQRPTSDETQKLVNDIGFKGAAAVKVAACLDNLFRLFLEYDALIAEINPLVITAEGSAVAADAVLEIDDSALSRHPEFKASELERISDPLAREGRAIGVSYVGLGGDIGLICSGAGLGMATIDCISRWGRPANFLETGGGITADLMAQAMRLVLKKPGLRGLLINLYGGINPIHEGAQGVARVIQEEGLTIPIVAKALGNFQEETWKILEQAGVTVIKTIDTEGAVEELFRQVNR